MSLKLFFTFQCNGLTDLVMLLKRIYIFFSNSSFVVMSSLFLFLILLHLHYIALLLQLLLHLLFFLLLLLFLLILFLLLLLLPLQLLQLLLPLHLKLTCIYLSFIPHIPSPLLSLSSKSSPLHTSFSLISYFPFASLLLPSGSGLDSFQQ